MASNTGMFGNIDLKNPGAIIFLMIILTVSVQVIVAIFPTVVTNFGALAGLPNFSFASFFLEGGVAWLIFGAAILFGIFSLLGLRFGASKR